VSLDREADEVVLAIRDQGVGFDPELEMYKEGIGLISMRERIGLVRGTLTIQSKPHLGTEITAQVPIALRTDVNHKTASA